MAYISGTVVNALSGVPIKDALVEAKVSCLTMTNDKGYFKMAVDTGTNTVYILKDGFATFVHNVDIKADIDYGTIKLNEI